MKFNKNTKTHADDKEKQTILWYVVVISLTLFVLSDIVQSEARQRRGQYNLWQNEQFNAYNLLRTFCMFIIH